VSATGFRQTLEYFKEDCRRFSNYDEAGKKIGLIRYFSLLMRSEIMAMFLYRLSHYFYSRKIRFMGAFLYRLNITVTGADINPRSVIGPGCVIVHTVGTVIHASIGKNVLITARVIIYPGHNVSEMSKPPTIGDNVTIGSASVVLGDVTVADGVTVSAFSIITESIEEPGVVVRRIPGMDSVSIDRAGK
jgi:serine O-acetyltransferase